MKYLLIILAIFTISCEETIIDDYQAERKGDTCVYEGKQGKGFEYNMEEYCKDQVYIETKGIQDIYLSSELLWWCKDNYSKIEVSEGVYELPLYCADTGELGDTKRYIAEYLSDYVTKWLDNKEN